MLCFPVPTSARRRREVAGGLSHYLGIPQDQVFERLELHRELGLEPLDLVLFVLAFEETGGLVFPFEALEQVKHVGDLVELVAAWLSAWDEAERFEVEEDERFVKESGTWPKTEAPLGWKRKKAEG